MGESGHVPRTLILGLDGRHEHPQSEHVRHSLNSCTFVDQANGVIAGYRSQRPISDALWSEVDGLAGPGIDMDPNTLLLILDAVVSISVRGFEHRESLRAVRFQRWLHLPGTFTMNRALRGEGESPRR